MAIEERKISTLGELVDAVTPVEPDANTGRRRDHGIYRGMSRADRPLLTSLDQLGGVKPPHTKADLEEHILRNFIRYSRPRLASQPRNDWELLVQSQHHGLPTRLLDWSYSPLIAAHFATVDDALSGDRVIWRLDWQAVHKAFDFPTLAFSIEDLARHLAEDGSFTPWSLMSSTKSYDFACMIDPPSVDARIETQGAVLTLCSDKRHSFDEFLIKHGLGSALVRFIFPSEAVPRLRDQLDLVGIDERLIYPDLDGVAARIRRYYS